MHINFLSTHPFVEFAIFALLQVLLSLMKLWARPKMQFNRYFATQMSFEWKLNAKKKELSTKLITVSWQGRARNGRQPVAYYIWCAHLGAYAHAKILMQLTYIHTNIETRKVTLKYLFRYRKQCLPYKWANKALISISATLGKPKRSKVASVS